VWLYIIKNIAYYSSSLLRLLSTNEGFLSFALQKNVNVLIAIIYTTINASEAVWKIRSSITSVVKLKNMERYASHL
jgi:hypothetical protein